MDEVEKYLNAALELPPGKRAEIAARLLESLDDVEDDDVEEAWAAEIERRCAALDSGEAGTMDWSEFRAQIEREIFGR